MAKHDRPARTKAPPRIAAIAPADLRALLQDPRQVAPAVRSQLAGLELGEPGDTVNVIVVRSPDRTTAANVARAVEMLPGLVDKTRRRIDEARLAGATEALAQLAPRDETQAAIEIENARLRSEFLQRHPTLGSPDIHKLSGSKSDNRAATAHRWKRDGRIFALTVKGEDRYPAFQLQDGQPRPVIADILAVLSKHMSPWQIALWFVSGNGWLSDRPPVACLDDPEAVIAAARHEAEPIIG
jgi:hypothetical protein